jgi:hypothetical protein
MRGSVVIAIPLAGNSTVQYRSASSTSPLRLVTRDVPAHVQVYTKVAGTAPVDADDTVVIPEGLRDAPVKARLALDDSSPPCDAAIDPPTRTGDAS